MGAIDFATTIAPGMRDVLLTGKVKEAVTRKDPKRRTGQAYDAVVMDAPPTGRITRFLNVTTEVAGLARVGPIRSQADSVMAVLRSKKSAVHLVTLLEEMPVQETVDGVAELRSAELPVGAVLVNRTRDPLLSETDLAAAREGGLDRAELAAGLKAAGIEADEPLLDTLTGEAADHAQRVQLEQEERGVLVQLERPTYELPQLPDSVDLGGLYRLAELLTEQGMAG
jgi:anion-transporting  ArsA/GET3 family ATPase